MRRFAETCEAVAATTKKNEKIRLVGDYLKSLPLDEAAQAAVFFTGLPFPRKQERVLAVGGSLLWQAVNNIAGGIDPAAGSKIYLKHGDLGDTVAEVLAGRVTSEDPNLSEVAAAFDDLGKRRGPSQKLPVVEKLLGRVSALEAKYVVKIITGDLRIGLRESLVEEAIAHAFAQPVAAVQRANMLAGDIGQTLRLAAVARLDEARLQLFHALGFMLASPAETTAEAMEYFPEGAVVEHKYDGIRAQAHKSGAEVKFYSRTLDEIVEFPELCEPLRALPGEFVLDGEIVAWRAGRALPFTELQQRLGRKEPDLFISAAIPVVYLAFDLLYANGEVLMDLPLSHRRGRLAALLAAGTHPALQLAPQALCHSEEDLQQRFEAAFDRGNEGVMVKGPATPYTPGRRGKAWLKLKRPMATLDVVVTAVEYGHGKRRGLLSDYTFAVRSGSGLANIGKAYSGLTDAEIIQYTGYFKQHMVEDQGHRLVVQPNVVIEVAFNNIQRSSRHDSGYALRFPRIVRLRQDKSAAEIDTLERVQQLYELQNAGTARQDVRRT